MKLKYDFSVMDLGGELLAIPIDSGEDSRFFLRINETVADILKILKDDVSEDEIVAALLKEYNAAEDDIRQCVRKTVGMLRDKNLLCG